MGTGKVAPSAGKKEHPRLAIGVGGGDSDGRELNISEPWKTLSQKGFMKTRTPISKICKTMTAPAFDAPIVKLMAMANQSLRIRNHTQ